MKNLQLNLFLLLALLFLGCKNPEVNIPSTDFLQQEIEQIIGEIKNGQYEETHGLVVYHNDELITEQYFDPFSADELHYQYSVTKSVTSTLIGIAIDQGLIQNVDQKLLDFFPEYTDIQNLNERKEKITLKDILSMRAGFSWDEWTYSYLDERNNAHQLIRSGDMMQFMLDRPMAAEPGQQFTYNSGATMLLSGIIQSVSGQSAEDFARDNLFDPLGISSWRWEKGKDSLSNTGWGLHLLPKDMAKIGRLFLNNGMWDGRQVVSKNWVTESIQNHGNNYGYQWWLDGQDESYSARGWGGQTIVVVPDHHLVIVSTAGNFNGGGLALGLQIKDRLVAALNRK